MENECCVMFIFGALYTPRGSSWQSEGLVPTVIAEQARPTSLWTLFGPDAHEGIRQAMANQEVV